MTEEKKTTEVQCKRPGCRRTFFAQNKKLYCRSTCVYKHYKQRRAERIRALEAAAKKESDNG